MKLRVNKRLRIGVAVVMAVLTTLLPHLTVRSSAQQDNAVQRVVPGRVSASRPGERGETYYALEGRITRVRTHFVDGTTATAERTLDGSIVATLRDAAANNINRVSIARASAAATMNFARNFGTGVSYVIKSEVRPTLDWSATQTHLLHRDGVDDATPSIWRDGFVRRRGAGPRAEDRLAIRRLESEFGETLSAVTTVARSKATDRFDGVPVRGDVLVTKIFDRGVQIGIANYLTYERVFAWKIQGVTDGVVKAEHLARDHGGWPFTPDMAWMNIQTMAFYLWSLEQAQSPVQAMKESGPSIVKKVGQFFAPTLSAEPGCNYLHWLDGTVLRACCDAHDRCYTAAGGCSGWSWWYWPIGTGWGCSICNTAVFVCFATGGGVKGPYYESP